MAAVAAAQPEACVSRAAVVAAARAYLGVPFRHQGRSREGVDCAGLVILVARGLGLVAADLDVTGYARRPDGVSLLAACRMHLAPVSLTRIAPGDVVVFRIDQDPQHLAIVADHACAGAGGVSMVHAYAPARRVAENRLDETWLARLVAAYALPGVR